jgi:chromosome segregation ATPase
MMEIKLLKLTLTNFKGIRDLTLEPNGLDMLISGDNGVGKTTCMDAFLWLLFGKDSQGKADFAIKTLDADGHEIHNLDHAVEGMLDIDGRPVTLKKTYREKYTKRRGQARSEFTGHTTEYAIDGVPVQKKEWDARIQSIIDEDTFRLLTSPTHFNSLHWQKRRQILLDVCGDISDADVIASDKDLNALPDILGNRSIDDLRKIVVGKKREINDKLKEIPARIDELSRSVAEADGYNTEEIRARITRLEIDIQKARDNLNGSELRKRKAELETQIAEAQAAWRKSREKDESKLDEDIRLVGQKLAKANDELQPISDSIEDHEKNILRIEQEMEQLRSEFKEIAAQEYAGATVCPTCGQDLAEDQVDAAKQKHNEQKARKLAEINQLGKGLKDSTERFRNTIKTLQNKQATLEKSIADLSSKLEQAEKAKAEYVEQMDKAQGEEIDALVAKLVEADGAIRTAATQGTADTSAWEAELREEQAKLSQIDSAKKTRVRIDELAADEKKLAAEYEALEHQDYLMDKFVVAKVGMLESKINSRFGLARFRLFDEQINGGVSETCVTLYDGVPYGQGLNSGAEIMIGCDIVKTLQEHYGIRAPLWLDHAESCRYPIHMDCQTIFLEVSADKELKAITR